MNELFKRLPIRFMMVIIICFLVYLCYITTTALNKGAEIKLFGYEVTWKSDVKSLRDKFDKSEQQLGIERQKSARLEFQQNENAQSLLSGQQQLRLCENRLSEYELTLTQQYSSIQQLETQVQQLQDNKNTLNRLLALCQSIDSKKRNLDSKREEFKSINSSYEAARAACISKDDATYFQPCVKAGEKKGVVDALNAEIQEIVKDISEDKKLCEKLIDKLKVLQ